MIRTKREHILLDLSKKTALRHIGRAFRLTHEPGALGLGCTSNGLTLAGVPLLKKEASGFVPRSRDEIRDLLETAYGTDLTASELPSSLRIIAKALNEGISRTRMIASVLMRLPELDWPTAARLAKADENFRKFDPDQPRDWHGRWTARDIADAPFQGGLE